MDTILSASYADKRVDAVMCNNDALALGGTCFLEKMLDMEQRNSHIRLLQEWIVILPTSMRLLLGKLV